MRRPKTNNHRRQEDYTTAIKFLSINKQVKYVANVEPVYAHLVLNKKI